MWLTIVWYVQAHIKRIMTTSSATRNQHWATLKQQAANNTHARAPTHAPNSKQPPTPTTLTTTTTTTTTSPCVRTQENIRSANIRVACLQFGPQRRPHLQENWIASNELPDTNSLQANNNIQTATIGTQLRRNLQPTTVIMHAHTHTYTHTCNHTQPKG